MDIATKITLRELDDEINRCISQFLTRFQNLVRLSATPSDTTTEQAAQQCFQMKLEREALILAARELQGVSRTMKKLWLAGPLRPLGEDETNPQTSEDQKRVIEMAQKLMADYRGSTSHQQEDDGDAKPGIEDRKNSMLFI